MAYPLAGWQSDVWLTATPSISTTNENCTDSGDHTNYQASVHTFWDWASTFTVQNSPNGSSGWVTVTDYTFQWSTGKLIFNSARVVGTNNYTRISVGSYFTATQLDGSHQWTLALKTATKDSTTFQAASGWQNVTAILKMATGKIATYRNDDRISKEIGNLLAFQCFIDKANNVRWQGYATITGAAPMVDVNGLETQEITFTTSRDIYLLTS